ncbi:hypothetical protein WR25_03640 [Diploscapter pachys]|uniref:Uncharacterized protein n=1 Tax=Diploscapter pachys TaxID=2018661 RepID=A0A2A2KN55_9BILA|nr:hypothetical protein WR25_03640 [Diploscapter pachys]
MSKYWRCFGEGLVEIALGEFDGRQTELSRPAEQPSRVARQSSSIFLQLMTFVKFIKNHPHQLGKFISGILIAHERTGEVAGIDRSIEDELVGAVHEVADSVGAGKEVARATSQLVVSIGTRRAIGRLTGQEPVQLAVTYHSRDGGGGRRRRVRLGGSACGHC